ncbi:MAG: hypothetical protein HRU15_20870, partial [Planctomycetes bacterium]|nr:hypothetical protein [Planctomycetota bacterium]
MANIQISLEGPLALEYAVAHIADFDFRPGFLSQGRIQRLECYYCISGTGHVQMDDRATDLRTGMMFCSGAGEVVRKIWCDENESLQVILLGCVGTEIQGMFHRAIGEMNCVFTPNNAGVIYETCKAMLKSAADYEPFADQICKTYLPVLMLQIQQGLMFEQN